MRVALFPADQTGCGMYRMMWPGQAVADEVEISFSQTLPLRLTAGDPVRVVAAPRLDVDVVVLQRPLARVLGDAIPHLQAHGIAVVVDIDDDFSCLHPQHPLRHYAHPKVNAEINWRHLQRACALADLVTVSTPALAERYGARGNARVVRNCVPAGMLNVNADRDGRTVGWAGFTMTHPGDLTVTHGGVAQALADTGACFLNIGDGVNVKRDLGLATEPDVTGPVPFEEYPAAVAQLDVGIVPLTATRFNDAKSYLKGLEYAALGIPFVASPLPEYELLAADGIGLLAQDRSRDWRRQCARLLTDPGELAEQGRAIVAERHTYERQAWRWAEVWDEAVALRTGAVRVAA